MHTKHFSIYVGSSCPRQSLKGVGIDLSVLRFVNLMDGGLSLFGEILITTSPAKFGRNFEKMS